jgi:type VI secretion system secreted protein VgrG
MARLEPYFPLLLQHEGGFVNHPNDPGGATNKGVTLNTFRHFFGQDKTVEDLKKITNAQAFRVAKEGFWDKVWGDRIKDQSVAEIVFDHAWGAGNGRAVKKLQRILNEHFGNNLAVDGIMGPKTLAATNAAEPKKLFNLYWDARADYYEYITNVNTKLKVFLKGWMNRLGTFKKKSLWHTVVWRFYSQEGL